MAIYQITKDGLKALPETRFDAEGILERKDIQRLLRGNIEVLGEGLMVIAEEFCDWADSARRIDLLCLDTDANLVVVELKRSDEGSFMDLQAIRYAAMVSAMTFRQMVDALAQFRNPGQPDIEAAQAGILEFLHWDTPKEDEFGIDVRIILASADFSKELTTAVMWLNDQELDIRCVRLKPYRQNDGTVLVDVQQVIPLPEAADFQIRIGAKKKEERQHHIERYDLRYRFWTEFLSLARTQTNLQVRRSPTKNNSITAYALLPGFDLNCTVRMDEAQVELWIGLGSGRDEDNLNAFKALMLHKDEIERTFGTELSWQDLPGNSGCAIRYSLPQGGYRSPSEQWPQIQKALLDAMVRLDTALRPHVMALKI